MLPGLPGTEVCRVLRQRSPAGARVPVIMLTAKDAEIDKVVGLELGADDYVTKPFSSRELVARIRAVLRRRSEPEDLAPPTLEVGPVRMDVDRHVVSVRGGAVSLPLKEFELLELLLRNAGRVLDPDAAHRSDLGRGLRRRHQDARRSRQAAAVEDRAGSVGAATPGDGTRARLQVRTVTGYGDAVGSGLTSSGLGVASPPSVGSGLTVSITAATVGRAVGVASA